MTKMTDKEIMFLVGWLAIMVACAATQMPFIWWVVVIAGKVCLGLGEWKRVG